jgi:pimeloyl-ACP methyl ester carboxylesterase
MRDRLLTLLSHDAAGLLIAALLGAGVAAGGLALGGPAGGALVAAGVALGIALGLASLRHLLRLARARRAHPPPGRLLRLQGPGGHRVHLLAEGEAPPGRPAVVWFGGAHAGGHSLHHLHRALRQHTRSILIDRPGTGWSDTGPFPRSTAREAEEMLAALQAAGERGPFVLAGHSFGGLLAANMARRRPDLVHTLLLLDPTPLETLVFGPRLALLQAMHREAWRGGLLQLFGVDVARRQEARLRADPRVAALTDRVEQLQGPAAAAARPVEARAGHYFAQASIYRELTPEGVAACGWETVVYDRDLGDLPVWLVAPKDDQDAELHSLPEARASEAGVQRRMVSFFAATRERYLAASTRSTRVVAPAGSGHNFTYEHPEWTAEVVRRAVEGQAPP